MSTLRMKLIFGSEISGDTTVTTEFLETPLMSTYLIGFVVSDYEFINNEASRQPDDTMLAIAVSFIMNSLEIYQRVFLMTGERYSR
jgi:aminopeptidase N